MDNLVKARGSPPPGHKNILIKAFSKDPPAAQHRVAVKSARHDDESDRLACHR